MAEIGEYALYFALAMALLGIAAGFAGGIMKNEAWGDVAERSVWVVTLLLSVSMAALFWALFSNDFRFAYVAQHSARDMGLGYRLSALWGGQAGSLLLWGWMVAIYGSTALFANRHTQRSQVPWVALCLLLNVTFFLVLCAFISRPFEMLPPVEVRSDGNGLNPLLQHPMMAIHPLMLYAGFTGFVVPYAYAFAAMVTGELGTSWFRVTRRWTLIAWTALGVGLVLGGRWAYEVLGWGGYWAWDPVENAALMPWLAGTAYLHSVMIQEKRDMLKTWNLALIGLTYILCLFGTFLTRSGVVQSVHAFTNSGLFTPLFFSYVAISAVAFFALLIYRRRDLQTPNRLESMVSREAGFLLNNWAFMAVLVVVFWGTLLPVVSEAISGKRTTVGPLFFNTMAGWISLFLLFLTGVGPLIAWRQASMSNIRRQFVWPGIVSVVVGSILTVVFWGQWTIWTLSCWVLSCFVVGTIVQEYTRAIRARVSRRGESPFTAMATLIRRNQRRYGGYVVHLGIVLMFIAMSGRVFYQETLENVKVGESITIKDYELRYLTAEPIPAQHYGGTTARVAIYRDGKPLATMLPEKRNYWLEQQPTSIPAIYSTWQEDVYVVLNAVEADGSATFKVHHNSLVNWLWSGAVVAILGCILIMWPHAEATREASRSQN